MKDLITTVQKAQPEFNALMKLHADKGSVPALVAQEIGFLEEMMYYTPALQKCEPETIIFALKSVIRKGITLDPDAGLCYLTTRSVKVGEGKWVTALKATPSVNGEISIQRMAGRILDVKMDEMKINAEGEFTEIVVQLLVPTDGKTEWRSFTVNNADILRLRSFSHKDRSRNKQDSATRDYSNALYRSGKNGTVDLEFARTKAVKMALKRAKTGMNPNEFAIDRETALERVVDLAPEIEESEAVEVGSESIIEEAAVEVVETVEEPITEVEETEEKEPEEVAEDLPGAESDSTEEDAEFMNDL